MGKLDGVGNNDTGTVFSALGSQVEEPSSVKKSRVKGHGVKDSISSATTTTISSSKSKDVKKTKRGSGTIKNRKKRDPERDRNLDFFPLNSRPTSPKSSFDRLTDWYDSLNGCERFCYVGGCIVTFGLLFLFSWLICAVAQADSN